MSSGGPLAKLMRVIPPGTHLVIGGTVVLGAASYIQIAAAGHALSSDPRAAVAELWSLAMTVSLGLFFPVEQELTRVVAARVVRGEGVAPVLRRAAVLTVGLLAVLCGALAVAARPVADQFFKGDLGLVWAFGATLVGMGLVYLSRGVLAGLGLFDSYGRSLAYDGALRIVLALGLLAAGVHEAIAYALVLAAAPLLATVFTLRPVVRGCHAGPPMAWSELFQNMTLLMGACVLAQGMANAPVLALALLAPSDSDLTNAVLSAAVLCRIPLFIFGSLQPTLMTGLSTAATAGDRSGFRRMLLRTCGVITVLGLLGGVPSVLFGSWLIHVFFKAPNVLHFLDFFWFAAGTMCYMLALILGQALMAMDRHRLQLLGWIVGTAALVGATFIPGAAATRVEFAYFAGSAVTAAVLLVSLWRVSGHWIATGEAVPRVGEPNPSATRATL
ncbi:O-antigen/teichoic acid export membrane protein [Streptacidiphilus sp. MAP12-20]|uniref:lipopolysaccharide biosynthesis protein n=1 Tax=Streptacidiphilus sp. MAP12-20 TaxID=3156299 RepID=UPI00351717D2